MFQALPSKGWVHCLFFFYFLFISDLFILSPAWWHWALPSHHHAYALVSAWMTHHLLLIIMLTLLCYSYLLLQTLPLQLCSLYIQLRSPYLYIFFYALTGSKGVPYLFIPGFSCWCTLTLIYTNICTDQSSLASKSIASGSLSTRTRQDCTTISLSGWNSTIIPQCWHSLACHSHDSTNALAVGSWSLYPWP